MEMKSVFLILTICSRTLTLQAFEKASNYKVFGEKGNK